MWVICHFEMAMAKMITATMMRRSMVGNTRSDLSNLTKYSHECAWQKRMKNIHGIGMPTVTSKMFEPTDDETAMSPWPFLATITDDSRSGTEVPAAMMVMPEMAVGMLRFCALVTSTTASTMK